MKTLERILRAIRNLPEEARKLLAIFFLLVAAVLLFNKWAVGVSSRLTLSPVSLSAKSLQPSTVAENPPAPLASIADSFKSLEKLVKNPSTDFVDSSKFLSQEVKGKVSDSVTGLYAVLEKTWKYIYPIRSVEQK